MRKWHVLFTKPKREKHVQAALAQSGVQVYIPLLPKRKGATPRPLFPRYVFAQLIAPGVHPAAIRWTPGLTDIVRVGDDYATVDEGVLDHLRRRIARATSPERVPFGRGQRVQLPEGHPLYGLEVVFDKPLTGGERAQVLVAMLGRLTRAQVAMADLDAVDRRVI